MLSMKNDNRKIIYIKNIHKNKFTHQSEANTTSNQLWTGFVNLLYAPKINLKSFILNNL